MSIQEMSLAPNPASAGNATSARRNCALFSMKLNSNDFNHPAEFKPIDLPLGKQQRELGQNGPTLPAESIPFCFKLL